MSKTPVARANGGDSLPSPIQPWYDRMSEVELAVFGQVGSAGTAMADAWADMIEEWSSFVAGRIRADVRTFHAMMHCRQPQQLQEIQSEFVQTAIDAYQAEAGRMGQLVEQATRAVSNRTGEPNGPDKAAPAAGHATPVAAGHATPV